MILFITQSLMISSVNASQSEGRFRAHLHVERRVMTQASEEKKLSKLVCQKEK